MTKRNITFLAAVAAAGFSLGGVAINQAAAQDAAQQIPEIELNTTLGNYQFDSDKFIGQRFSAVCPPLSIKDKADAIYGTDVYPSNNPICVAALHAGKVTTDGGKVTVQLNPGLESYEGSSRNDVDSGSLPGTKRSMVFVDAAGSSAADEARAPYIERLKWDSRFSRSGFAHKQLVGQQFTFNCPAAPADMKPRRVIGTDSYAQKAIICLAAVHAGKITTTDGGLVTVQMNPGIKKLVGSIRNGIETVDGSGSPHSISFVDGPAAGSTAASTPDASAPATTSN
ncbi:hypothetical protein HBA54_10320 [Pelagibius litoralis]|uniref:LCCL domain-containing protein n=1 Tax=Pelagibius litoralis TaxID=374515 RepID=A0A967EWY8_9PROT|nr:LCCL domain-containing protein [Pelagibius litoralis]NIA68988.1 hypothetical protein [Pelagibius litoralis]